MKRTLYSRPEQFSLSPLLCLLPSVGKTTRLEGLTSSLYARYEKVMHLRRELANDHSPESRAYDKKFNAEELMLKEVLDWLALKPRKE